MNYPKLRELNEKNEKAANNMVAEIARGVHAGNGNITPQGAAVVALETAEAILVQLAPADTDDGDNN